MRAAEEPLGPRQDIRRRRRRPARAFRRGDVARSARDREAPSVALPEEATQGKAVMIDSLDTIGPAVLRASWQASLLALGIVLVVRAIGDRLAPRWRYLLWSIVVARFLVVVTPASPW